MSNRMADCHPDKPHWARGFCGTCYQRWWNEQNPGKTRARIAARNKPATCHPDRLELARGMCGTCYRRWWRLANPGREWDRQAVSNKRRYAAKGPDERRAMMMKRYGLTVDDYNQRLIDQGGVCAICSSPPGDKYLHVDHCHSSGMVRGLLCMSCNSALGHARDDTSRLRAMIAYLQRSADSPEPGSRS